MKTYSNKTPGKNDKILILTPTKDMFSFLNLMMFVFMAFMGSSHRGAEDELGEEEFFCLLITGQHHQGGESRWVTLEREEGVGGSHLSERRE